MGVKYTSEACSASTRSTETILTFSTGSLFSGVWVRVRLCGPIIIEIFVWIRLPMRRDVRPVLTSMTTDGMATRIATGARPDTAVGA
jgi:hypothetical protein